MTTPFTLPRVFYTLPSGNESAGYLDDNFNYLDVIKPDIVDTIVTLKTIAPPTQLLGVLVLGTTVKGDGGGGFYWWNATDARADNGVSIIQPNAGGTGRWNLQTVIAVSITQAQVVAALVGATLIGPLTVLGVNEILAVVPSSVSTSDIWTPGNVISFTGNAGVTGFPAAPVAGTRRRLLCTGACTFTAGANLNVIGMNSGTTVTMAAGAIVDITATTTTTFDLEYTLTGSFTATMTGCSGGAITATWSYTIRNATVTLTCREFTSGTSNATTMTVTGLPATIKPSRNVYGPLYAAYDNSALVYTALWQLDTSGLFSTFTNAAASGWTNSGTKNCFIYPQDFTYRLGGN